METVRCGSIGCGQNAESALGGRKLCRSHFYDIAAKRVQEHTENLQKSEPAGGARAEILRFLSELISQTTTLTIRAKFLSPWQREQLRELSVAASGLYKRVQRSPRVPINMPILLYRDADPAANRELTHTVNVSKKGACIATTGSCAMDEKIWIQKVTEPERSATRVAWVKKNGAFQFLVGLDILDQPDFWKKELSSFKQK